MRAYTGALLLAVTSFALLPSAAYAVDIPTGGWAIVPTGDPFAGQTPIATLTSDTFYFFYGSTNAVAATGDLVSNVYRANDGTLGFSYTIQTHGFPPPATGGPNTTITAIPNLFVQGFYGISTDVTHGASPALTALRSGDGAILNFNFSSQTLPIQNEPYFYDFFAGNSATLYVQTNATTFDSPYATITLQNVDTRDYSGSYLGRFGVQSLSPNISGFLPEPLSVALLPLALAALQIHRQRSRVLN